MMEEKERQVEKSKPVSLPPFLSAFLHQSSPSLPAGLTSTSRTTRAPPPWPPLEISTDLAPVAMVILMTVGTACFLASEEAQASEEEWG